MRMKPISAQGWTLIFTILLIGLFWVGFAYSGEIEDLGKDLEIFSLTHDKNLFQNELLRIRAVEVKQKIESLKKAEEAKKMKKEDAKPDPQK